MIDNSERHILKNEDSTLSPKELAQQSNTIVKDVLNAEISMDILNTSNLLIKKDDRSDALDQALFKVTQELNSFVNHADKLDYAFAVASGLCSGIVDSLFVGEFSLENAHSWGNERTEQFVVKIAKSQGYKGDDVKGAIVFLAEKKEHRDNTIQKGFHLAADSNTNIFGGGTQHHLRDFAHHASITGLAFSVLTQFTK